MDFIKIKINKFLKIFRGFFANFLKFSFFFLFSLFFVACESFNEPSFFSETKFHQVSLNYQDSISGFQKYEDFYFSYPSKTILIGQNSGYFDYRDCRIFFGNNINFERNQLLTSQVEIQENVQNDGTREMISNALFENLDLVAYFVSFRNPSFGFWVTSDGNLQLINSPTSSNSRLKNVNDVSNCVNFVDFLADSFGQNRLYENNKFGFKLMVPQGFKLDNSDQTKLFKARGSLDDLDVLISLDIVAIQSSDEDSGDDNVEKKDGSLQRTDSVFENIVSETYYFKFQKVLDSENYLEILIEGPEVGREKISDFAQNFIKEIEFED